MTAAAAESPTGSPAGTGQSGQPSRFTVAVVGAGPRGTSFLERLLAAVEEWAEEYAADQPTVPVLDIVTIDPFAPGPGQVWRADQPAEFLMNTPAFFPTVAAVGTPGLRESSAAQTFDQWRMANPDIAHVLDRTDYPPRVTYGRYLAEVHREVTEALGASAAVGHIRHVPARVVRLEPAQPGTGPDSSTRHVLHLEPTESSTPSTLDADAVILAIGHQPARLNQDQRRLAEAATALGLQYRGPHLPADLDWSVLPAGAEVIVRGMGLNFFDLMAHLTAGRGGRFEPTDQGPGRSLTYAPSGREPVLHPASRRGLCYLPKAELDSFVPHAVSLKYLVADTVRGLHDEHGPLDFAAHLWPLIHRDVVRAYYNTLVRVRSEVLGGVERAGEFFARLVGLLEDAARGEPVTTHHAQELLHAYAPGMPFLDIRALARPFAGQVFTTAAAYQREVIGFLEGICAEAAAGEDSPLMVAIGTLHAARLHVKTMAAQGWITDASRRRDVSGWFESLVEGVASGPPLERVEQLLALARAGHVHFVGPDPQIETEAAGDVGPAHFTVTSPQVGGTEEEPGAASGEWLVEAMMPANRVLQAESELLVSLLAEGTAAPHTVEDEEGEPLPGHGLDVTARPHRLRDASGRVQETVFVLGLQLSSVQWGTAIAAEAGQGPDGRARTLGDAEAAARAVWGLARPR